MTFFIKFLPNVLRITNSAIYFYERVDLFPLYTVSGTGEANCVWHFFHRNTWRAKTWSFSNKQPRHSMVRWVLCLLMERYQHSVCANHWKSPEIFIWK